MNTSNFVAVCFVPLNTYVTNEHWYPEFMLNYDVVLSAGSHIKDLYSRKRAKTIKYLPTGCYVSHQSLLENVSRAIPSQFKGL